MRSRIRRWLGIEGQTWKHAVTSNNFGGQTVAEARVPTPPSEPGNWELVAVILSGYDYIFWWKAPACPDEASKGKSDVPFPLQDPDPDLVQYD